MLHAHSVPTGLFPGTPENEMATESQPMAFFESRQKFKYLPTSSHGAGSQINEHLFRAVDSFPTEHGRE